MREGDIVVTYDNASYERRWDLIAGRVPGRKAEEIERFWIMRHGEAYAEKRNDFNSKT